MSLVFWLKSLEFSDDTMVPLRADSTLVIVGPNNAGKSKALQDISKLCASQNSYHRKVVKKVYLECIGTRTEFVSHFAGAAFLEGGVVHGLFDARIGTDDLKELLSEPRDRDVGRLSAFFVALADTETRLEISKPAPAFHALDEAAKHPIQTAYADDTVERELSESFCAAFSAPLFVNRYAGASIPIHVGQTPTGGPKEFLEHCRHIPQLHEQGDGMRSFAGCLLYVCASRAFTIMIDEPEAFLHPPQARQLGMMLVKRFRKGKQLILSTHSGDLLRGILDAGPSNVSIVRLQRDGDVNRATVLPSAEISAVWKDPALRFSNVLDGIFHERVIVCEADSDCRFFQAIANALSESANIPMPDAMFTSANGKPRLPMVAEWLRKLGVSVTVIADFDVLREEVLLERLVTAQGGDWKLLAKIWRAVDSAVRQAHKPRSVQDISTSVASAFANWPSAKTYTREDAKTISPLIKSGDEWDAPKHSGLASLPGGGASSAARELLSRLRELKIHVIDDGELESFHRSTPKKSAAWVNAVLERDLVNDPELRAAREFVRRIFPLVAFDDPNSAPIPPTLTPNSPSDAIVERKTKKSSGGAQPLYSPTTIPASLRPATESVAGSPVSRLAAPQETRRSARLALYVFVAVLVTAAAIAMIVLRLT